MPALEHPSAADLQAFAIGALSDEAARSVESHLSECASCLAVAAVAPDDTLVTLLRTAETSKAGLVTPGPAFAETMALSNDGTAPEPPQGPPELARHTRYRVIRTLGRGGMGHVWLAEHTVMGRSVALKLIRPEFLDKADAVERFRREVRAAAKLKHPNIVAAHDADQAGELHFLVMEYIDGETLAERIQAGPVAIGDACRWIIDAAHGLEHARENGLIHRDVKPHNLILERATGRVKVLDFGLAGVASGEATGLTGGNVVIGTPDYIAPEQAEDARTADTRSDVYALGCTLYHLFAGRPPFPGDAVLKKLDAHRLHAPEPIAAIRQDVTPALAELVARMLAKDPAQRPQTPGEVAVALEHILAGGGEIPPVRPHRRKKGPDHWPWRVLAVTAAVMVCAYFLSTWLIGQMLDKGHLVIVLDGDDAEIAITRDGELVRHIHTKTERNVPLRPGTYDLELLRAAGYRLDAEQVTLPRGQTVFVRVERVPPSPIEPDMAAAANGVNLVGSPDSPWTDLRPWVDVSADREHGSLVRQSHEERPVFHVRDIGGGARVSLPIRPEGDYEIRARITRLEGNDSFNLMLPIPRTHVQAGLYIDGLRGRDAYTGLEWRDGPSLAMLKSELKSRLVNGRGYDLLVRVTGRAGKARIGLDVNGHAILDFDAAGHEFRQGVDIRTKDPRHLGIGATASTFRVEQIDVRMRSGTARLGNRTSDAGIPEGPQELAGAADAPWTDLLRGLNIPSSRIDGMWGFQGGVQSTSLLAGDPKEKGGKLALPVWPKGDYEVRLRFARTAGDDCLTLMLPIPGAPGTQTALVIDGYAAQGGVVGLEYVNKKPFGAHLKDLLGKRLTNDVVYTLVVQVTESSGKAAVRAEIDGKKVSEWSGPVADLTPSFSWFTPDRTQLGLGVWDNCAFRIDGIDFRPLTGTATWKPGPLPKSVAEKPGQVGRFGRYKGSLHTLVLSPDGGHAYLSDAGLSKWALAGRGMVWERDGLDSTVPAPSGDGTVLTAWGPDGFAHVLNPATGQDLRKFPIPPEPVTYAVLNRDGTRAVSAHRAIDTARPAVRLWDVVNGKELLQFQGVAEETSALAMSPDGSRIATTGRSGAVRLWDSTGKELHVFRGHEGPVASVAFSADGKFLVTGAEDHVVRVWSVEERRCASVLTGHSVGVTHAAFTPDASRVVSVGASDNKGDGVRVWDWRTGDQLHHFSEVRAAFRVVAVAPDGRNAVTGEEEGTVRVWRLPSVPDAEPESVGPIRRFGRFAGSAQAVAVSPDGRSVYSLDTAVVKWELGTGKMLWACELDADGSHHLSASMTGKHVLAGCLDGTIRVLDAQTGREIRRFSRDASQILVVAVSPDGRRAVSSSGAGKGEAKASIRVWDIDTARELFELKGHTDEAWSVCYSPDGSRIATASEDGTIRVWNAANGQDLAVLKGHKGAVSAVAFAAGGKRLASGGQDLTVRVWDLDRKEAVHVLEGHDVWVTDVAFTPDGTRVLSVSSHWDLAASDGLRVWDAATGKPLYEGVPAGIQAIGLAVERDGQYAVTGGLDGAIRLWKLPGSPSK